MSSQWVIGNARRSGGAAGFTLVELLVVVLLIGITITFAALRLQRDADRLAELEARRFAVLIDHVREETVLTGRPMALQIDEGEGSYRFLAAGNGWEAVVGDDILRNRRLPDVVTMRLEGIAAAIGDERYLILFDTVGDVTPFELDLKGEQATFRVSLDESQNIVVTEVPPAEG